MSVCLSHIQIYLLFIDKFESGEKINSYSVLVEIHEENVEGGWNGRYRIGECGVGSYGSVWGPVAGSSEHNEESDMRLPP